MTNLSFFVFFKKYLSSYNIHYQQKKYKRNGEFTMNNLQTPFRYDFVGSFLRPQALKDAKAAFQAGKISKAQLDTITEDEIRKVVAKQKELGFHVITDGEFRRTFWHLDFMWGFDGVAHEATDNGVQFHNELAAAADADGGSQAQAHWKMDHGDRDPGSAGAGRDRHGASGARCRRDAQPVGYRLSSDRRHAAGADRSNRADADSKGNGTVRSDRSACADAAGRRGAAAADDHAVARRRADRRLR